MRTRAGSRHLDAPLSAFLLLGPSVEVLWHVWVASNRAQLHRTLVRLQTNCIYRNKVILRVYS